MIDFPKKTLREVAPRRQAVLLRADYNVPLNPDGAITDDFRLTASLPTLKYLIARKNRVVICAHLGRPGGEVNLKFSLEPVAKRMSELLGQDVKFAPDCIGDAAVVAAKKLAPGEVLLLENLRFHPGEKSNDPNFAKELVKASGARLFVQDGFGVVHRAAASTVAITGFLPSVAGLLVEKEYLAIKSATDDPARPLVAVLGGAKISDKIQLIQRFISIADGGVVIGGAMANNFLKFMKYDVGQSLVEDGLDDVASEIITTAKQKYGAAYDEKFILPGDVAISADGDPAGQRLNVGLNDVSGAEKILDIGDATIERAANLIKSARTVIWNGTLGMAEFSQFAHGSARVALELAQNKGRIVSVIGGGDTADFVRHWDAAGGASFTHISTGGGASLALMAGEILPGIAALLDK